MAIGLRLSMLLRELTYEARFVFTCHRTILSVPAAMR